MSVERDLVIGIDSSTTATKAIAWDCYGRAVADSRVGIEMMSPRPDWYEQHAEEWWQALCATLRDLSTRLDPRRFAAVCITNQRETFVPVDAAGRPLRNALLWLDARSRAEVQALNERFGRDTLHDLTGKGPSTTQGLSKLVWLQTHEPEVVRRTHKFVEPHAYLVYHLTGRWATSLACADPMGIVDMRAGTWAADLLHALNLDTAQFAEIVPPGMVIGEVTDVAAKQTGLLAGTPVVAGAGDGQCASLGVNVTQPGRAYINLGTAMVSGVYSDRYVANRACRTQCSPVQGGFVLEEVLNAGTFLVSWFVDSFGPDVRDLKLPLSAEEVLEAAASKVPPGALGLMVVPYWKGVMPPYWDAGARGITIGWTGAHRQEHFYRALLEGIAFEHRLGMDGICAATGQPVNEFILLGGGSRSALWCQIFADMTGQPVVRARTAEATNLGAGILAATAAGWYADVRDAANAMTGTAHVFEPDAATHAVYDRLYQEVYRGLFLAVQPYVDRLTALNDAAGDRLV
ncbi:MAG: FGGY-family carbohydrate kinase [Chloroflexi bacterium]|nr:FGGY-family carbohydrate kinase [Chloroflexota bacterium]